MSTKANEMKRVYQINMDFLTNLRILLSVPDKREYPIIDGLQEIEYNNIKICITGIQSLINTIMVNAEYIDECILDELDELCNYIYGMCHHIVLTEYEKLKQVARNQKQELSEIKDKSCYKARSLEHFIFTNNKVRLQYKKFLDAKYGTFNALCDFVSTEEPLIIISAAYPSVVDLLMELRLGIISDITKLQKRYKREYTICRLLCPKDII